MQYRSDMDCFVPLMEKFYGMYGFYPKYPVTDAGYGSFNNYIFCQEHSMEKFMKFPMYKNETANWNYHNDPFRAVNFGTDEDGRLVCPYAEKCKKADKNRTVRINAELTAMHEEVLENLESIHGALLRMNRSIQSEGTFGIIKYDRWYKRIVRRRLDSVKLELFLVSIGHNLYKFQNKKMRLQKAA